MLILASKSPRRQELLNLIGVEFTVKASNINEEGVLATTSSELAVSLATLKGLEVSRKYPNPVLAADTVVEIEGEFLGKPQDENQAIEMLRKLSGRYHNVVTGVVICQRGQILDSFSELTKVYFKKLTEEEINWYVKTKDPFDKAGGYGIQTQGGIFVEKIEGCYFNVVGLPLAKTANSLRKLGLYKLKVN
ncbi:Maf family protein [Anaerobranca gottschalkii]|uniref:dTTP/UTP pyrophosphatase n=1 Tax=Anaerobranca gottschalkii DSM 13577 TaxID=1120990 RepID=A0A1H9YAP5_9FIRM|nr:Maf family protein [Anaerobranca gottschalkii]SES65930.1 septum formation protein [Anaerobranca gottschalkii DSM 13577]